MPVRPTLTIPTPCHESWAAMTPTAQGRHCATCDKVVLDFTQKSDAEILALLRGINSPCGRFRADQLQRPLLPPPVPAPRWRTWLAATAAVLGLREVSSTASHAQQPTQQTGTHPNRQPIMHTTWQPLVQQTTPDSMVNIVVRGQVTDAQNHDPLPGVTVLVKNTTTGVSTNADGTFELQLPASATPYQALIFSSIGYITEEINLGATAKQEILVNLALDSRVLGGLVVYSKPWPWHPRALWYQLTRPFRQ